MYLKLWGETHATLSAHLLPPLCTRPRPSFQAPYVLTVRALDNGEDSQLFTDTEVYITVGDVSSNDGVPDFERPKVDEIAYVAEVSSIEAKIHQG